jgi:hypothetical protein
MTRRDTHGLRPAGAEPQKDELDESIDKLLDGITQDLAYLKGQSESSLRERDDALRRLAAAQREVAGLREHRQQEADRKLGEALDEFNFTTGLTPGVMSFEAFRRLPLDQQAAIPESQRRAIFEADARRRSQT